jgi:hypothetical protein
MSASTSTSHPDAAHLSSVNEETVTVRKFFFLDEHILARNVEATDTATDIPRYFEGPAFDFFFNKFAPDGTPMADAADYNKIKAALVDKSGKVDDVDNCIRRACAFKVPKLSLNDPQACRTSSTRRTSSTQGRVP